MNKSKNTFLKSKMNKDIDARILPNNEYRNAVNVQVNKSEGSNVGSLENVLGNQLVANVATHTGTSGLYCIGFLEDESTGITYLFFTNYKDKNPLNLDYFPNAKNYIISFNAGNNNELITLVEGAFLNFSKTHSIYGVNILENLLFWTDNRNQPRKINVDLANTNPNQPPTYYTTEDQISVAKYNPHASIELYDKSRIGTAVTDEYETTMKDVSSKNLPNGGNGKLNALVAANATQIIVKGFKGDIQVGSASPYGAGSSVSYIDGLGNIAQGTLAGATVSAAVYNAPLWTIDVTGGSFPELASDTEIILNANPYYDSKFAGDPTYLDDKFVRFAYRFKFEDNEYSLFSTFTQAAFIPKQDGYFMYVEKPDLDKIDNQSETARSTIVNFVENKVDQIKLRIPLPFKNYNMFSSLKVTDIDVLYKESDQIPVKVIDTISAEEVFNASATCEVRTNSTGLNVAVQGILGGIKIGSYVTGFGITTDVKVVNYTPDNANVNPSVSGTIELSSSQTLTAGQTLTVGEPDFHVYDYQSKKPFRTLPERDIVRVYDKTPVRALAQETSGNRVMYANFQNKHTAPEFIDYNVAITPKSFFNLNGSTADINGNFPIGTTVIDINNLKPGPVFIGMIVVCEGVPEGTLITNVNGNQVTLSNPTTSVLVNLQLVVFEKGGTEENTTSRIEYPSSSLKTNRNYQVGIVLSDRFGRQSGVILSNNKEVSVSGAQTFIGSTIYSPYNTLDIAPDSWPGDSIKLIFNKTIAATKDITKGLPGIYNGDSTSSAYNPLGWYTYKVVVKQTEQEYYNVYLPGIMSGYPQDLTLEQGQTSHIVLTSDNINKVPRDLNEVGPTQDQFRSSVKLYGRVENTSTEVTLALTNNGQSNIQYYPGREFDIAVTISTMNDLFGYDPLDPPIPNFFPQFYTFDSNPYIARLSTAEKIGQIADVNYTAVTGFVAVSESTSTLLLYGVSGATADIETGDTVSGPGFPENLITATATPFVGPGASIDQTTTAGSTGVELTFNQNFSSSVFVGDEATGSGIAPGTIVTDIVQDTASPPLFTTVVISQAAGVVLGSTVTFKKPAQLVVSENVTVSLGDRISVSSATKPGLQYLAIYETEPVKSLLDIFWESSSTGVINDINNILLNEGTRGEAAGDIAPFNDSPFDESLRRDPTTGEYPNITTAPFGLVNSFGQPIPTADITEPLSLDSVVNGFGDDVQTIYINNDPGVTPVVTPVFSFNPVAGTDLFNIKIAEGFSRNIYFGSVVELHTFTFNFSAIVNEQPTGVISKTLTLTNVAPAFYTWQGTSFKALAAQTNTTQIKVYDPSNANSVAPGWKVVNNTNPSAFSNLIVAGSGYTLGTSTFNVVGAPNNPGFASIQPTPANVTQNSTTINFVQVSEFLTTGASNALLQIGNSVAFNSEFDINSTSSIPAGTVITAFSEGAPGTVTFSNTVKTTNNGGGAFGNGSGDRFSFFTPNFLVVDQQVNVTAGDLIYVYDAPAWNNCPIQPFAPGNANVEIVGTLKGVNGAGFNVNDLFGTNQGNKKWRELTMTIVNQYTGNDPTQNNVEYFALSNDGNLTGSDGIGVPLSVPSVGQVDLLNLGAGDDNMPADIYTLDLELADPGDVVTCQVQVNTGLKLCTVPPLGSGTPFGVQEYTVTANPRVAGSLPVLKWKYIVVTICEGTAGQSTLVGGNGANGYWRWSADGGVNNGEGTTTGNPSWASAVSSAGSNNIVLTSGGVPGETSCSGGWNTGVVSWEDIGDPGGFQMPGLRSSMLSMPCVDLDGDGTNAQDQRYSTSIELTAGSGTSVPLNPPVGNFVFTVI